MKNFVMGLVAALLLCSNAAMAQPIIRGTTPEEAAAAAGAARFAQREYLKRALFGPGHLPKGCTWELVDPSGEYSALNLAINCGGEFLTACDVQGYECEP